MDPAVVAKLTDAFADAVRAVASGEVRSPEDVLAHVVASAARAVPGADGAGITQVTAEGRIEQRAPSSSWVADLDQRQADLGEGPCVLAARIREDGTASSSVVTLTQGHNEVVTVADMAVVGRLRWPMWASDAVKAGVGSLLSFTMAPPGERGSALNFYARTVDAFSPASVLAGEAFAAQAAIALFGARRAAELHQALQTRDVIGQAKGILIERYGITDDQAFAMLVRSSQDTNIKLVDVARWLSNDAQKPGRTAG
jgi:hypothetical protein